MEEREGAREPERERERMGGGEGEGEGRERGNLFFYQVIKRAHVNFGEVPQRRRFVTFTVLPFPTSAPNGTISRKGEDERVFRVTVDLDACGRRCCAGGEYDRRIDDIEVDLKVWGCDGGGEDE